ncbi:hypothetical protein OOZ15_08545 [Galbibacter sp. EGI 63066]|uniref:hypothetical protein n=1 Tax=Galbibacter sp. EGI 63066 TaxID=2993559 RepID=UPI002249209B|nr:hypothetical protein [Galbibacter sp. EGI 63066]MCX2679982.1 hypothetical protein [Galbibacter sp. EGI 63066]
MNLTTLLSKIERNNPLDFGDIFSKAIDLFKKVWVQGLLLLIASMILVLPVFLIIYVPLIGAAAANSQGAEVPPEFPIGIMLLLIPIIIIIQTIGLGLMAGFYKMVRKRDKDEEAKVSDLLFYLKKEYFGKLFVLALIVLGIAILATLACYLPVFYVMVPLSFVSVIFAFNPELQPKEIIKACFKLGNKKWLITFGLIIISGLLAEIVGLLLCGIGILFTASFSYLPVYLIYKETVGFEDEDEIGQIGEEEI